MCNLCQSVHGWAYRRSFLLRRKSFLVCAISASLGRGGKTCWETNHGVRDSCCQDQQYGSLSGKLEPNSSPLSRHRGCFSNTNRQILALFFGKWFCCVFEAFFIQTLLARVRSIRQAPYVRFVCLFTAERLSVLHVDTSSFQINAKRQTQPFVLLLIGWQV